MATGAITVTLGGMAERAKAHVDSGRYSSMSEVMRAGLRALDREEAMVDALYREKVLEALRDPGPFLDLDDATAEMAERKRRRRGE